MAERTVSEWFEEIERGLEYRRLYGIEDAWCRLEQMFYNVHPSCGNSGPNIIMSTGDALMSSLTVPYPKVLVSARRPDLVSVAKIVETVDDMLIEDMNLSDEMESVTLNTFLFGTGIVKIGFDSEFGFDPRYDMGGAVMPIGATLNQFSSKMERIEYNANITPGMPWAKSVLPHDIVVPWGVKDIDEAQWIAHRIVRHVDDVKADVRYQTRGLKPIMTMKDFAKSYESVRKPYRMGSDAPLNSWEAGDVEYVEMWEIRDVKSGKIVVIASGHDRFLRNEMDTLQLGGLPFVAMRFVPRSRNFWVTPDAYYLEQSHAELTDIAIQRQKHRRLSVLKLLVQEGAIEQTELDKLLSSEVGGVVKINQSVSDIRTAVTTFTPSINNQLPIEEENVRRNSREMVGMSRNQLGEFESSGRRSATEAATVAQASNLRMDRRQSRVAKTYSDVIWVVNKLVSKFWTTPRTAMVMDPSGQQLWLNFTGADLVGDYRYKIRFSVESQQTPEGRRQEALSLYSALRADPMINPVELANVLSRAYNDPNLELVFSGPQMMLNQQAQMQQAAQGGQQQQKPKGGGRIAQTN